MNSKARCSKAFDITDTNEIKYIHSFFFNVKIPVFRHLFISKRVKILNARKVQISDDAKILVPTLNYQLEIAKLSLIHAQPILLIKF